MRPVILTFVALVVAVAVLERLRVIGFRYPRAVENEPLVSPVAVIRAEGDHWTLEDGRVLRMAVVMEHVEEDTVGKGTFHVDLEDGGGESRVFVKHRRWICGTPWSRLIAIPLFPDDVPVNRRELVGFATVESTLSRR